MSLADITILDIVALIWFLACWVGYGQFAQRRSRSTPSLVTALRVFRGRWMERICAREQHQADATLLSNLLRGALFFASTTIFILAGLVALLGTAQRVTEVVSQLPFTAPFSLWLWEIKVLILIYIFVYAFFKFTWSAWQYNALSIVVGAAPGPATNPGAVAAYIKAASRVAALAGGSFNDAIRTYYFSMAVVTWFLHPVLLIATTTWVTYVVYRREFASPALAALLLAAEPVKPAKPD
ncbi:MAG: DUF599 domain-containing protein [Rhodospirillales bacterium]